MITTEEGLEKIGRKFKIGAAYFATPALEGQPKKLAVVIGKCGATLQVAFVDELAIGRTKEIEGRDFATVRTRTGQYNISAYVEANTADVSIVNDILKAQRKEARGE